MEKLVKQRIFLGVSILLILALCILGLIKLANNNPSIPFLIEKDIRIGNRNAKTVLVEYSDFECPACATYHLFVKQLLKDFDGKILFVYRFFPLPQHQNAMPSAKAAYAAGLQNKFWEMQDLLFNNQSEWVEQKEADKVFEKYAKLLNLNMAKFKTDFNSKETKEKIENDFQGGEKAGINSTPTFFLNNKQIQNPGSFEEFRQIIEAALQ